MQKIKNKISKINKTHLLIAGVLLLILLFVCLLWFNNSTSLQAEAPLVAKVSFDGDYRIGDGEWQKIEEGKHISATKGDVTLRGNFHMWAPDGEYVGIYRGEMPIAFYVNHINLTIREGENDPFVVDIEDSRYGDSVCGVTWTAYAFMGDPEETIEILIHNPHGFGNETAIDEMLSTMAFWSGIEFEKEMLESGSTERNIGLVLVLASIMILGIALFSSLIHVKNSKIIWLLGSLILFAGIYFAYNADGVSFWSESFVSNTTILGASMMLYMFLFSIFIVCFMSVMRKVGELTVILLGVANAIFFFLPIVSDIRFYDLWTWWIATQIIANVVLSVCLVREFLISKTRLKWFYLSALLPLTAFAVDVLGTYIGIWKGGVVSQYVFTILFVVAIIMVLKLIPNNINAATKAKELEMEKIVLNSELAESRISTMMSQIRPHFIYNTLGSIEQLCVLDPPKAGALVHDFAKYLRGNFGELDNPKPILMSQEMDHVHHYVSIENVRFPDMTFTFEMNSEDFRIPALTIQPIVENAIKHGLMKLQNGGTIHVESYETDTDYYVSVVDDGVGFDTSLLLDERKHVGLRNIRERLKAMVNGTIEIESTRGVGTKVLIKIPKESKK
ncbi:MAG: histidine kinase [Clostridia bacterium]|nr:histidine kinase [Clostridia bacterium]